METRAWDIKTLLSRPADLPFKVEKMCKGIIIYHCITGKSYFLRSKFLMEAVRYFCKVPKLPGLWSVHTFYFLERGSITLPIIVDKSPSLRRGFWESPTRDGSFVALSLLKVLHSDPTSMTRSPINVNTNLNGLVRTGFNEHCVIPNSALLF